MTRSVAPTRSEAEREAVAELEAWRSHAVPDASAPLDAEDVARLVRDCFTTLGIDPAVGDDFSVNTVHYYRRRDIVDAPEGRTSAARYTVRHVWQAAGARMAGYLGLVTLSEAQQVLRDADDSTLISFVAARVADARARQAVRDVPSSAGGFRPLAASGVVAERSLPGVSLRTASIVPLPFEAWCVMPAGHPALASSDGARELVRAMAAALGVSTAERSTS